MRITRLEPGRAAAPPRGAPGKAQFKEGIGFTEVLDQQPAAAPAETGGADAVLPALDLAVAQEIMGEPAVRDRQARQHGSDMLDALARLQARLLAGSSGPERQRLEDLAKWRPAAADPGLEAALQAIALRAAVELAKLP